MVDLHAMSLKALSSAGRQRHHDRRGGPLDPSINHSDSMAANTDPALLIELRDQVQAGPGRPLEFRLVKPRQ